MVFTTKPLHSIIFTRCEESLNSLVRCAHALVRLTILHSWWIKIVRTHQPWSNLYFLHVDLSANNRVPHNKKASNFYHEIFFRILAFLLDYFTEIAVTVRLNCFKCTEYTLNLKPPELCPSIALLEERWTVVASCLLSIGRRFKSGSKDYSILSYSILFEGVTSSAAVAEWLRRLTRNQFPSGSVGSNPTDCEIDALTLNLGFLPEENDLLQLMFTAVHLHSMPVIAVCRNPRNEPIFFVFCNSIHDSIWYSWASYWIALSVWKLPLHCNEVIDLKTDNLDRVSIPRKIVETFAVEQSIYGTTYDPKWWTQVGKYWQNIHCFTCLLRKFDC